MSVFVERTRTAEDHLVNLWELLEEEWIIAHNLACSCDRHNICVNVCTGWWGRAIGPPTDHLERVIIFRHSRGAPTDIWGSIVIIHCREEECIGKYAPWGNLEGQGVQIANSSRLEVVYCHSFFQSGSELKITPPSSRVVLTVYKFNTFPLFKKERFFLSNRGPPTDPLEEVMTFSCPLGSQLPTDPFRCLDYASVDLYLINSARLVSLFWAWKYWVWATDFRQYWSRLWMPKPKDHDVTACSGSTQVMF